jgi:zinc D-Ala-D-Ala dipeptidase
MRKLLLLNALPLLSLTSVGANNLPQSFVYLKAIDPTIKQDIRYASNHNFIGKPIPGYEAAECILTKKAAQQLQAVNNELKQSGLALKVYDCYRPTMAVDYFMSWINQIEQQQMKAEFFPSVAKTDFVKSNYVGSPSGHSRGSTVDLTIVPLAATKQAIYKKNQKLVACYRPYNERFHDNSIDMGTGYDCMDELSHPDNKDVNLVAYSNRQLLQNIMGKYSFIGVPSEWWHFTLKDEPFPDTYFNFPIRGK